MPSSLRLSLFATAIALASPVAAIAKPVLYLCELGNVHPKVNWVPENMAFVVDDGQVRVIDPIILHFNKKPMDASVRRRNNGELLISWAITNGRSTTGSPMPAMSHKAYLNTEKQTVRVFVQSSRYSGARVRGNGACTKRTDGKLPRTLR